MFAASAGAGTDVGMESKGVVSSPNDLHDVLDPVELGKGTCWEATEEILVQRRASILEQSASDFTRTKTSNKPPEPGWMGIGEDDFNNGFHGGARKEGLFLLVHHRREMFCKAKKAICESPATLRRQGAMKIKCDSVWDESRECSALLDLRWMEDNKTQVKSLNGHFALLQQTLPHGNQLSVTRTEENLQNLGDGTFGQMLLDVDKSFKGSSAHPTKNSAFHSASVFFYGHRVRAYHCERLTFLLSHPDALSAHASSGYRPSENPPLRTLGAFFCRM